MGIVLYCVDKSWNPKHKPAWCDLQIRDSDCHKKPRIFHFTGISWPTDKLHNASMAWKIPCSNHEIPYSPIYSKLTRIRRELTEQWSAWQPVNLALIWRLNLKEIPMYMKESIICSLKELNLALHWLSMESKVFIEWTHCWYEHTWCALKIAPAAKRDDVIMVICCLVCNTAIMCNTAILRRRQHYNDDVITIRAPSILLHPSPQISATWDRHLLWPW